MTPSLSMHTMDFAKGKARNDQIDNPTGMIAPNTEQRTKKLSPERKIQTLKPRT